MEEAMILAAIDEDSSEIPEEEQGEFIGKLTLIRLRIEIEKEINRVEEEKAMIHASDAFEKGFIEKKAEVEKIQSISHSIVEYFTLCSIFIESFSIKLLSQELIEEKYTGAKKTRTLLEHRLNQETREDILLRSGIIDESVKSEMTYIRNRRNRLLHDFMDHLLLKGIGDIISDIDRAYELFYQLSNRVTEGETTTLRIDMDG